MNGVLLGFEIATGIALFFVVFLVVIPRISLPLRAFWYHRVNTTKTAPPEVRRYLLKKGIGHLKSAQRANKLPPDDVEKIAKQIYLAALTDEEGVYKGMQGEMISEAMHFLGLLVWCATCNRPLFTREAIKIGEEYFCENCGKAKTAT
jgi:superfamily II helicase